MSEAVLSLHVAARSLVGNDVDPLYRMDLATRVATQLDVTEAGIAANADSGGGPITADGSEVAYASGASNLVAGDTNGRDDIFVATPLR